MSICHGSAFWIDGFEIDPNGLKISGPVGFVSLEPKIMDVLMLMATSPSQTILRQTFLDEVWGEAQGCDESLTRAISVLRKSFRDQEGRSTIIETVPRKGYRLVGAVSTIPPVPKSEITNGTVLASEIITKRLDLSFWRGRKGYGSIIATSLILLVGAVSTLVQQQASVSLETVETTRNLVQVLPFRSIDETSGMEATTARMSSQMASILAEEAIPTSFGPQHGEMQPEFELSGDVWTQSEQLRATVRLKDSATGLVLWSETLDDPDISQTDPGYSLAMKTAGVLDCLKTWRSESYQSAPDIMQLYARFCEGYETGNVKDYSVLTEPIYEAEPDNAMALVLHGWAVRHKVTHYKLSPEPEHRTALEEAESLFAAALQINPDLEVAALYHSLTTQAQSDILRYESILAEAASQNGLPEIVYDEYANLLRRTGRLRQAMWAYRRMDQADVSNPTTLARLGWMYATEGDFQQSERYFQQAERINPKAGELLTRRKQVSLWLHNDDSLQDLLSNLPDNEVLDNAQAENCDKVYIQQMLEGRSDPVVLRAACADQDEVWTSRMFVGLGDIDNAYAVMEDYDWAIYPDATIYLYYPWMNEFRQDPRFWPLMDQIGLSEFWAETGRWPDFCRTEVHAERCPVNS